MVFSSTSSTPIKKRRQEEKVEIVEITWISLSLSLSCFAPLFSATWEGDIDEPPCIDKKISVARSVVQTWPFSIEQPNFLSSAEKIRVRIDKNFEW